MNEQDRLKTENKALRERVAFLERYIADMEQIEGRYLEIIKSLNAHMETLRKALKLDA